MLHGLQGRRPNNANDDARGLFIDFVKANRAPTGRTPDKYGRVHGAEYYLDARFTALRRRTSTDTTTPTEAIVSDVFIKALPAHVRKPGFSTPETWFSELFGPMSEHGHTSIFPTKTDYCAECARINETIAHIEAQVKKHRAQSDQSLQRQSVIATLQTEIDQLKAHRKEHKQEAQKAIDVYKDVKSNAREQYVEVCKQFDDLVLDYEGDLENFDETSDAVEQFLEQASECDLVASSDYQQDKSYPHWGKSPCPGPVYFYSHNTVYVQIIHVPSFGDSESRAARLVYLRDESVGGSKQSNDTLGTWFEMLNGNAAGFINPPTNRTGYDDSGAIDEDAPTMAAIDEDAPTTAAAGDADGENDDDDDDDDDGRAVEAPASPPPEAAEDATESLAAEGAVVHAHEEAPDPALAPPAEQPPPALGRGNRKKRVPEKYSSSARPQKGGRR